MKKLLLLAILIPFLVSAQDGIKNKTVLFQSDLHDSIPYRIPAIVELRNGSMLALTDYRHCGNDIGYGRVDIHGRLLKGKKWGKEFALIEGTGELGAVDCGYGDAAVVADRESNEILITLVCGNTVYYHQTTNRQNPNRITAMRSLDGGKTWKKEEITEQVYRFFDYAPGGCVQSCFVSSGQIFQSRIIKVGSHYRRNSRMVV